MASLYLSKFPPSSLEHPGTTISAAARHEEVLDERLRRLASGEDAVSLWSETKERIRAQAKMPMALGVPHD
jgi:hypothetical protein